MHQTKFLIQDARYGRASVILRALTEFARQVAPNRIQIAAAYISLGGAKELVSNLMSVVPGFADAEKQWLTSIDFGHTDPSALIYLGQLSNSEVRVSNGNEVLLAGLSPSASFHPKAYHFERIAQYRKGDARALIVGSANLTRGALLTNAEQGIALHHSGIQLGRDASVVQGFTDFKAWWGEAWPASNIADAVFVASYKLARKAHKPPKDNVPGLNSYKDRKILEVPLADGLGWSHARCFWIETHELYKNRGPDKPGNQIDARRGTRVFFGFPPTQVKRNTILGHVRIQYEQGDIVSRSVRFADNSMDKINLPIPGVDGPKTYDHTILHFERISSDLFRLTKGNQAQARDWKRKAVAQEMVYSLGGARQFGFYS